MTNVEMHRAFYAKYITAKSACKDPSIQKAFAIIEREKYVGPGPWNVHTPTGYVSTGMSDPAILYQDILIGLKTDQGVNNGEPSLHARCLDAASISRGETITHIGSGTGYYTALLACLTGEAGRVDAYEIDPVLSAHAKSNLAHLEHVRVLEESGTNAVLRRSDVIYVSAGATHPLDSWLDALNVGGRLIFPLTPNRGIGGMLLVTHVAPGSYAAKFICPAMFIECSGARDDATGELLIDAFESKTTDAVKSLRRKTPADESAWFVGADWWLSTCAPHEVAA